MWVNKLKWWVSGVTPRKMARVAEVWFEIVAEWLKLPLREINALTCSEGSLELIAWRRRIRRLPGESLELYRRRVHFAFVNERDAGSAKGMANILERLGLGFVSVKERVEGRDWDIVVLNVSGSDLSANNEVLSELVALYGRTCRSYEFTTTSNIEVYSHPFSFGNIQSNSFSELK